jgi:D-glycero-alpha-D-manno-heptose-7-phosphate kinase
MSSRSPVGRRQWPNWRGRPSLFIPARRENVILERQLEATADRMNVLRSMRGLAYEMRDALGNDGDLDRFAALLHEGWALKRSLGCGISNDHVNEWYEAA